MAIRAKDIYHGGKKSRSRAGVIIFIVLAVLIALILVFYGLRQFAVYDENGNATIILPFTHKAEASPQASEAPSASPSASPGASQSTSPSASPETSTEPSAPASVSPSPPETPQQSEPVSSEPVPSPGTAAG